MLLVAGSPDLVLSSKPYPKESQTTYRSGALGKPSVDQFHRIST